MAGIGQNINSAWGFKRGPIAKTSQFVKRTPSNIDRVTMLTNWWFGPKISPTVLGARLKIFSGGIWNIVKQGALKRWTGSIWKAVGVNGFMIFKNNEYEHIELS